MRTDSSNPLIRGNAPAPRLKLTYVAVALAVACPGAAIALPTGEQVVAGQVSVSRPNPRDLKVQQGSSNAIVNWQGFSIAGNESVSFQQPSAASVILNRVLGANPSEIYGRLAANGQVFLVNPSGVLFGRSASVDVGGLVASTLGISNEDFLAGRYRFSANGAPGKVENQGLLRSRDGGTIALLGGQVSNEGTIAARLGTAAAAAGHKITLDFAGDGLTRITVDEAAVGAQIRNQGMVLADGGQAVLTARAANALTETVVNQSGLVRAQALVERNGRIVLDGGETGATIVSGTLDASGIKAGQKGGEIQVLGHNVGVMDRALLDARGDAGGGTVLVGGDYQGKNPALRNAETSFFGADAVINADALTNGNGGKVIAWGNETTHAHGTISARGGAQGGDGGFIETSGATLDPSGIRVAAGAPRGRNGRWLLDPTDVTINGPLAASISGTLNGGADVTVRTANAGGGAGDITMLAGTVIDKTGGGDATLALNAHDDISILGNAQIRSSSGHLNVDLISDLDAIGGGGISLGTVGSPTPATILTNGGNVRLFGQCDTAAGSCADASGRAGGVTGVGIVNTRIDTRTGQTPGTPSGNIVVRGEGLAVGTGPFIGVSLSGSTLVSSNGSITLDGVGPDLGVRIGAGAAGSPAIATETGSVDIFGLGTGVGAGFGPKGVFLASATISTTAGGSVNIRGRAGGAFSIGVDSDDATVTTSGAGAGTIMVSGESTAASLGVRLGGVTRLGGPGTSGNIIVRATNAGDADSIELGGTIQTTGVINLRPGGVSASGALTAADADEIEIVAPVEAGSFVLDTLELFSLADGASHVVIGGSTHTGPITVFDAVTFRDNVTLQNAGAGSNGISINAALGSPGNSITLASAGPVTQTAPITAGSLLLQGTGPGSNFVLLNAANAVSQFAASTPFGGGVQFRNGQALTIGPLASVGFDSGTNSPVAISIANTVSFGDFLAQTLAGNLNLAHNITTLASNIDLVSAGIFNNLGSGVLTPGGSGRWRVWANTWVGEDRGGLVATSPFPNIYGCTFPGSCAPGVAIPATGDRFIYVQRPSVTVTVDNKTRRFLFPNPPFTVTLAGFVNGDTPADAVAGAVTTSATQISRVGTYPLAGAFTSPVGYQVSVVDGTLSITPYDITQTPGRPDVINTSQSYLYDRNVGIANMCIASGPMVVDKAARAGDRLEMEWSRVRQKPNLSNCIELDERNTCFDF